VSDNHKYVKSPINFSLMQYKCIILRVYQQIQADNLSLVSAGVAFYFLLAVFPLLAGVISLYGLLVQPTELQSHIGLLIRILPEQSRYLLEEQLLAIIEQSSKNLGWGIFLSISLTLWSASKGAGALVEACHITYNEKNQRDFLIGILVRFAVTLIMIFIIIFSLILITALPTLIAYLVDIEINKADVKWITWPMLFVLFNLSLAALYRYAPHRVNPKWKWVTPGALIATFLWVGASVGFSFYVSEYGSYNETYGSVGGVIVLLMWFYLSAFIVLWGSELNAAIEQQTLYDSTVGKDKPLGERGAVVADTVPRGL